jgi:hypothetical protein
MKLDSGNIVLIQTWEANAEAAVEFEDSSDFGNPMYTHGPIRVPPGFTPESNSQAPSLDIHLQESTVHKQSG